MSTTTDARRPTIRTTRGWAISVLQEARAAGNAKSTDGCRTAPIRTRASMPSTWPGAIRRLDAAVAEIREVLDSIGDTCPECPPE
jgi:hypothetical protein